MKNPLSTPHATKPLLGEMRAHLANITQAIRVLGSCRLAGCKCASDAVISGLRKRELYRRYLQQFNRRPL